MVTKISKILFLTSFFLVASSCYSNSSILPDSFLECLSETVPSALSVLYVPTNSSYEPILESTAQNLRFVNHSNPKPLAIITAMLYSHVQSAVVCSKQNGLQVRVRSGGHDYEGLSYTSKVPFIVVDLQNLTSIIVDKERKTAWVEPGVTLGQLYYWIANQTSNTSGFPAGVCPTVGAGGHISGGGTGYLLRKYGLAADNVIDALLVDANGRILDKTSMGEDLFWAIRGGGAASFGIVVAWKLNLVDVPSKVTVFTLNKTIEQDVINLIYKWQRIAYNLTEDLMIRLFILTEEQGSNTSTQAMFTALFLNTSDHLLPLMNERFPELGLRKEDCQEMSWIESILYYSGYESLDDLRDRKSDPKTNFKAKSDFLVEPLSKCAIENLWKWCSEKANVTISMHSYGGRMNEIPESEIPFPHRKGILYDIYYLVKWDKQDDITARRNINWMRRLYSNMKHYVSKHPRQAYVNIRDLDIGQNDAHGATYEQARKWGVKYFMDNFKSLAIVKGMVDPDNFFAFEQSIPPLFTDGQREMNKSVLNTDLQTSAYSSFFSPLCTTTKCCSFD